MTITQQEAAAQNARRLVSRTVGVADNIGARGRLRFRVAVITTAANRVRADEPVLTSTDAIAFITRQTEAATADGVKILFKIGITLPTFLVTDDDTWTPW